MPRAHRHYLPGHVWHITHRCHARELLLNAKLDRSQWRLRLYEAKVRYELSVLNFVVTSNHIHLLAYDAAGDDSISRSLQYIEGGTAQAYNRRRGRHGAFWQDRYHAVAVDTDSCLWRCLVSSISTWFELAWCRIRENGAMADIARLRRREVDIACWTWRGRQR
jgi:putative transposase